MNKDSSLELNLDFGRVLLLYSKSEFHSSWSVRMAALYTLPAIVLKQYLLIKDANDNPLGYASWAYFDIKTEVKYLNDPHSIVLNDWNSGDRMWLIDWVSPVDKMVTEHLYRQLKHQIFPNSVARSLRVKIGSSNAKIKSYGGINIPPADRRLKLLNYYLELKKFSACINSKVQF